MLQGNTSPAQRHAFPLKGSSARISATRLLGRRPVQFLLDGVCGAIAITLAYALRFDMQLPKWGRHQLLLWAPAMFLLDPLAIFLFRGGRSAAQYFGLKDLRTLGQRLAALNAVLFLCSYTLQGRHFMPAGIVVIDLLLMLFLSGGVRAMQRLESESRQRVAASQRILIAGTSDTVAGAVRQLQPLYGDGIRGVLVEDEQAFNRSLFGVPVLGSTGELGASLHANEIDLLFLCFGGPEGPGFDDRSGGALRCAGEVSAFGA